MFLDYGTYEKMGGTLEQSAFDRLNRKAESLIRSQAAGQTGKRIDDLTEIPSAISDCVFDLISFLSDCPVGRQISGESQSLGGQSESISYATLTEEQIHNECEDMIYNTFYGAGFGELLYRGSKL